MTDEDRASYFAKREKRHRLMNVIRALQVLAIAALIIVKVYNVLYR